MFRPVFSRLVARVAPLALVLVAAGCTQPAEVSGSTLGSTFSISDNVPEVKGSDSHVQLVFEEDDGETLRTLAIKLHDPDTLEVGVSIALSDDDSAPTVEATVGDLVLSENNGVTIKSAENWRATHSVSGELVLEQKSPFFAGTFRAVMDDGGLLVGDFVVAP